MARRPRAHALVIALLSVAQAGKVERDLRGAVAVAASEAAQASRAGQYGGFGQADFERQRSPRRLEGDADWLDV